jgi:two-component system chemotaxis sensor kinase CheA
MEESDLSRTQRLKLQELNYAEEGYGYKKVLIVDDNLLNIKVARRALEQFDLIIDECYNGKECIDIISEDNDYDLILMDIMMPVMSGEETLNKLKEIEDFDTPVIALTADAEVGSEEKYESKGFVDYIAKPFSKEQIGEKLDKVFMQKEILAHDDKMIDNNNTVYENEWEGE